MSEFTISMSEDRDSDEPFLIHIQSKEGSSLVTMSAISKAHARLTVSSLLTLLRVTSPDCEIVIDHSFGNSTQLPIPRADGWKKQIVSDDDDIRAVEGPPSWFRGLDGRVCNSTRLLKTYGKHANEPRHPYGYN